MFLVVILDVLFLSLLLVSKMSLKVKVKFNPEQATKAQRWSRVIALLFL